MKTTRATIVTFALAAALVPALALAATPADTGAGTHAVTPRADQVIAAARSAGLPVAPLYDLVAPAAPRAFGPCSGLNSFYCAYAWDFANQCCYPVWIATGAFCPTVCW